MAAFVYNMSDTWNNAGTTFAAIKMDVTNTASAADSLLMELLVGAIRKFAVNPVGAINNYNLFTDSTNYERLHVGFGGPASNKAYIFSHAAGSGSNRDIRIQAGNADGSSGAYIDIGQAGGISFSRAGVGDFWLINNTGHFEALGGFDISARNVRTTATTVASLVAAATAGAGARSFVTDANATTFNSTVAGGGSNSVPVFSDGTNWKIG